MTTVIATRRAPRQSPEGTRPTAGRRGQFVGTRRFSSSSQLRITLIRVGMAAGS